MITERVYSIDYKRLIVLLLPTFLRRPVLFGLLKSLVLPVITLHREFEVNRAKGIYQANHTGQVCYLRGMLNDAFDIDQRRIYISDAEPLGWTILYTKDQFTAAGGKQPTTLGRADSATGGVLMFNEGNTGAHLVAKQGSIGAIGSDFTVMIPLALRGVIDENRVISLINFYKLASKRYAIQYF